LPDGTTFPQALQSLPHGGAALLALVSIVGLLLWGAGRRVLRAGFAAIGFAVGAGFGWLLARAVGLESWMALAPLLAAAVFGLVLACAMALLVRVSVAAILALVGATLAPLGFSAVSSLNRAEEDPASSVSAEDLLPDELSRYFENDGQVRVERGEEIVEDDGAIEEPGASSREGGSEPTAFTAPESAAMEAIGLNDDAQAALAQARSELNQFWDACVTWWGDQREASRPGLIIAALLGLLIGALFGTLAPNLATSVVTATGGSLLALTCLRALAARYIPDFSASMPSSAAAWLLPWVGLSVLGIFVQWMGGRDRADKTA